MDTGGARTKRNGPKNHGESLGSTQSTTSQNANNAAAWHFLGCGVLGIVTAAENLGPPFLFIVEPTGDGLGCVELRCEAESFNAVRDALSDQLTTQGRSIGLR